MDVIDHNARFPASVVTAASGQTEKSGLATGKSALPSRTDIVSPACQVRKMPTTDVNLGGQPF
jgi:hypothetical protein